MRAFVAIALPESVCAALRQLGAQLAESGADVKWVEAGHLHLTLRFLDEITQAQRQVVETLLGDLTGRHAPFAMGLDAVGAFPSTGAPRVVWVGMSEGRARLVQLADELEQGLRARGWPAEERPFSAHVTLGRVRSPRRREQLIERLRSAAWRPPPAWQVDAVRLYESVLGSAGPTYTILAEVPLLGKRAEG